MRQLGAGWGEAMLRVNGVKADARSGAWDVGC